MSDSPDSKPNITTYLLGGLLLIFVFASGYLYRQNQQLSGSSKDQAKVEVTTDQQKIAQDAQKEETKPQVQTVKASNSAITTFEEKKDAQICSENGKPNVYLFSTTWCPHCEWIKETFDRVMNEYIAAGKINAYHWELDNGDNTLTQEVETEVPTEQRAVYKEFNPDGSIPTFVFGCKYFRVGNGYEAQKDLVSEEKEFRAVIEDLLANQ
ncbi:thioredoxin family protein [Candidatus Beckwithbacteria bacterium]|nr:thioredoxin family protein [Candidatus Beckwithbacteria bacterium]